MSLQRCRSERVEKWLRGSAETNDFSPRQKGARIQKTTETRAFSKGERSKKQDGVKERNSEKKQGQDEVTAKVGNSGGVTGI